MHRAEVVERTRLVEREAERLRRLDATAVDLTVAAREARERRRRCATGERWEGRRRDSRRHGVWHRVFVRPRHHCAFRDLDRGGSEGEAFDGHRSRWPGRTRTRENGHRCEETYAEHTY